MIRQISNEVNMPTGGLALWWLGNAGFAIRYGRVLMFIDPVIEVKSEIDTNISEIGLRLLHELPLRAYQVDRVDIVMLTHHHGDPCFLQDLSRSEWERLQVLPLSR